MSGVRQRLGDIQWAKLILALQNSVSKWAVRKTKVWGIWVYFSFLLLLLFFFLLFQVFCENLLGANAIENG